MVDQQQGFARRRIFQRYAAGKAGLVRRSDANRTDRDQGFSIGERRGVESGNPISHEPSP